ncbi:FKBP-type peptidyl-prolyl cis-trans isomerase [Roseisolibacter agri]|uniref:Peptidyl-prolyl cis-trans isomerase n=1 Tax=Roseisolibacter agri TaxID=2014610 RepID=A0AA37V0H8_9BACT|nr:peptidylprolyl isomerase [Roseisolibacter agri]GLC24520.1 peptidyl-prolyl cis-trans isomerase [Roseisolibacter agri]
MSHGSQEAKPGDTVRIHYTGTLRDGSEFDSSRGREPLAFTIGAGDVIPGFDAAVTGMTVGEQKTVTIPAAEAYGAQRPELVVTVPRAQVPPQITPRVGQRLQLGRGDQALMVVVREVGDDTLTLDGNHPLAGEDLTFALELVEVQEAAAAGTSRP